MEKVSAFYGTRLPVYGLFGKLTASATVAGILLDAPKKSVS
jgi:hypothetical protein